MGINLPAKKKIICLISLISFKIDFFVFFQAMTAHTGYNSSALLVHDIIHPVLFFKLEYSNINLPSSKISSLNY